jgi:hypothetical protein
LVWIEDALKSLGLEVKEETASSQPTNATTKPEEEMMDRFIVVDKSDFEITLRRLYAAQITKYNCECW